MASRSSIARWPSDTCSELVKLSNRTIHLLPMQGSDMWCVQAVAGCCDSWPFDDKGNARSAAFGFRSSQDRPSQYEK
jgi:hypothetical protein